MVTAKLQPSQQLIEEILLLLEEGELDRIRLLLAAEEGVDIAKLLESLPPEEREQVWELVPGDKDAEVLSEVGDVVLASLVEEMDVAEIAAAAAEMESDDLAYFIEELPEELGEEVKLQLSEDIRTKLEHALTFEEETAGRLMSSDVVSVRSDVTLEVVLRFLRKRGELPDNTNGLMVVDRDGRYLGMLPLQQLLTHDEDELVSDVMDTEDEPVPFDMDEVEVAKLFQEYDLLSVAVVDAENRLIGRITIDDVVDIIRDEADYAVMGMAGLNAEEDLFAPVVPSARRRALWLGINLLTAFLASWVIGQFEGVIDKIVALAVLMPIVASMGGIAGSQTLTLVIRGQALGQISPSNLFWLVNKEVLIGLLNGLLWALVIAFVAWLWFHDSGIAAVIAAAIVINLLAAAASGLLIPVLLRKLDIDPALSGPVILTTVTDVVGFLSFLGLATLFLM
ncbi:MAG TPA: magnesium transporter [Mariprofundaceae bacterium]|nr:magnesium transporter [Mariprofundaceae bacterium]